ncbi:MAG: TatD family hydrolase [Oscillospiraceae bacterium]|nr:TatD family hydrolase [Oscillospiraceae bacterium]
MKDNIRYIDIGLNLFCSQFEGSEEEIAENALNEGVDFIITGSSLKSSTKAAAFAQSHKGACFTAGIHPHDARSVDERTMGQLEKLLVMPGAVAVGECGLDFDRMFSPADVQKRVFEKHLELAQITGKPLFLHERSAAVDFYTILSSAPELAKRSVVHCFTGDEATAEMYLKLGCMIGITGWVCDDRRNGDLLKALKIIPPDRLMAETDAPYLLPRGKGLKNPNLPENIKYVVDKIAEVKCINKELLRRKILENTIGFFGRQANSN